ncbi:MAG: class I SAM-dependent methyltransferase [Pseudomonadota bacterium]
MTFNRWQHAQSTGAFAPTIGRVLVHGARASETYDDLGASIDVVTEYYPDFAALAARGFNAATRAEKKGYDQALVRIVKSKARTLAMVAEAYGSLKPGGFLIVDGQKTEGIESALSVIKARCQLGGVVSKSHGKLFWLTKTQDAAARFADWARSPQKLENGYVTLPGVFSSEGPDPGSELLIALVPPLAGAVADFGSGWGYLAGELLLERPDISEITLIEADKSAHDCAQLNVADPRARHIWGDVTDHRPDDPYDAIICNPPFHHGREAEPELGRAFIAAAARSLRPSGRFYMVANRHLPYEAALKQAFGTGRMLAEMQGYKLYEAAKPKRVRG